MAEPTPGVVPVVLQTGDPTNSVIIIRGLLAGGQDIIFRNGSVAPDLTLPPTGTLVADPANTLNVVNTLYIGERARFVALSNGVKLEVFDGTTWKTQIAWTEGAPA